VNYSEDPCQKPKTRQTSKQKNREMNSSRNQKKLRRFLLSGAVLVVCTCSLQFAKIDLKTLKKAEGACDILIRFTVWGFSYLAILIERGCKTVCILQP